MENDFAKSKAFFYIIILLLLLSLHSEKLKGAELILKNTASCTFFFFSCHFSVIIAHNTVIGGREAQFSSLLSFRCQYANEIWEVKKSPESYTEC